MSKELFVSSTPHETKVAIVEDDQLTEMYYERENEYTLAGSIYKGRVTRVLPGMQSAFVNVGLERDAFLYVSDFLLEEEDETEGLEQVISRSRPEIYEVSASPEHSEPIEAQGAAPSQPKPEPPAQPVSQYRSKPSTEYSLDPAQFAPGSMVLPGESISKYRRSGERHAPVATREAAPTETAQSAVQEETQP